MTWRGLSKNKSTLTFSWVCWPIPFLVFFHCVVLVTVESVCLHVLLICCGISCLFVLWLPLLITRNEVKVSYVLGIKCPASLKGMLWPLGSVEVASGRKFGCWKCGRCRELKCTRVGSESIWHVTRILCEQFGESSEFTRTLTDSISQPLSVEFKHT
jgi:hypothetical protein